MITKENADLEWNWKKLIETKPSLKIYAPKYLEIVDERKNKKLKDYKDE